jgi:hypothetical protein
MMNTDVAHHLADSYSAPTPKGEVTTESNFRPVTAAVLMAEEPEPVEWVWDRYLPKGALTLLVAYMKVGKSTLAYPLALAIAQGRPFLGFATMQTPVLMLAVEEHPRDVRARLERFGLLPDDPVHVHRGRLTPRDLLAVERYIRTHRIGLVLLDTLSRYWEIKDENDNAQVIQRISPFIDLAHETNTTIVLIHHESKAGGVGGRGIRGGSALLGAVDQALILEKSSGPADSTRRTIRAIGRYDDTPREMVIELTDEGYRRLGTPAETSAQEQAAMLLRLMDDQPRSPETLASSVGIPVTRVKQLLRRLYPENVRRQGTGTRGNPYTYCLPGPDSIPSGPDPLGGDQNRIEPTGADDEVIGMREVAA